MLQVNLGVLVKNENVKEDLLFCLRQYHQLAQGSDGEIQHKLCIGKSYLNILDLSFIVLSFYTLHVK